MFGLGIQELLFIMVLLAGVFGTRLFGVIDVVTGEFEDSSKKTQWLLVCLFLGLLGLIIYLAVGRRERLPKGTPRQ